MPSADKPGLFIVGGFVGLMDEGFAANAEVSRNF
jgi:hypothetical protein